MNIFLIILHKLTFRRLFEVFEEDADFFIITELVEGGELFDRIVSKSHYNENEARDLVKIFLDTMAYMHENNIVHRDLKPENLLLTSGIFKFCLLSLPCDIPFPLPLYIILTHLQLVFLLNTFFSGGRCQFEDR